MPEMMNDRLIFDIGMHTGRDTEFYLKKGFNVVAIEAHPLLVEQASLRFKDYLADGSLVICNVAVADYAGEVNFYINNRHSDWGTISKSFATRNEQLGTTNSVIQVKCVPFSSIVQQYGIPYYLKIDIEGADVLCLEALESFTARPKYISIEAPLDSLEEVERELSLLSRLDYHAFKIVNQAVNYRVRCPNPPLEGSFVDYKFDGLCSGPFGEEAPGRWMSAKETIRKYRRLLLEQRYFGAGRILYNTVFHKAYATIKGAPAGWYDFHARLGGDQEYS